MSPRVRVVLLCLGILRSVHALAAEPALATASLADLLRSTAHEHEIPAMAVVATRADKVLDIAAVGVRHAGHRDLVTPNDLFHFGSCTKAMTATMIGVLVERGRLSWDTKIVDAFPEWNAEIDPAYRNVTLTDLLSHRSGLASYTNFGQRYEWDELVAAGGAGSRPSQRRYFAHRALRHPPVVPPRTTYLYSNAGYAIAGAMAERVTGEGWEALMRTQLFEPLGIHAAFDWPASADPSQPWGHRETETGLRPHDPHDEFQEPACFAPAGGVAMSPVDYVKFLQLHLQGLAGHDGLLKAETVKHLHASAGRTVRGGAAYDEYALGWGVSKFEGEMASLHSGTVGTFYVTVAMWPSRDLAVAVFANSYGKRTEEAAKEIMRELAHRYP